MPPFLRHLLNYEAQEDGGGQPPVPGTEAEVIPGSDPAPPAEAQTTDAGQDPGPIPYSRFKEVNEAKKALEERLAPITELEELGYSPDDFRRLAGWESEYAQDPVGWALQNALEQETRADVKAQIEAAIAAKDGGSAETPPAPAPAAPADQASAETPDEPPAWAKPLVERHLDQERKEEAAARAQAYDSITNAWAELDKKDNIKGPSDGALATYIYTASSQHSEPVDILRAARENWLAERSAILAEAVAPAREGDTIPRTVPGSGDGQPVARVPERPRTLDQARKLAEEAEARGTLVPDWNV